MNKNVAEIVFKKVTDPEDRGATVHLTPGMLPCLLQLDDFQPETYVVGCNDVLAEIPLEDLDVATCQYAINLGKPKACNAYAGVGFWLDRDSNTVVIEMVETFTHPGMALEEAKRRGEKAIYAMKSGREIFLNGER